jgi:hypothetical protein
VSTDGKITVLSNFIYFKGLTVIAILTGIMSYTGRYGCSYIDTPSLNTSYGNLPDGCKIANGMGVAVVATAILTILLVSTRKHEVREIETKSSTQHVDVIELKVIERKHDV